MILAALTIDDLADRIDRLAERIGPAQRYLTVKQAAGYSGLSDDSIRKLLDNGKLTALRPVRGRIVIDRNQLDAHVLGSTARPRKGRGLDRKPRAR